MHFDTVVESAPVEALKLFRPEVHEDLSRARWFLLVRAMVVSRSPCGQVARTEASAAGSAANWMIYLPVGRRATTTC
jgi:hypothetical protein